MKASIDIGSNTVLLLIGEYQKDKVHVIRQEHHAPRLGKGVDAEKNLHSDSIERVVTVLNEYKKIMDQEFPSVDQPIVAATSAVRDAGNKKEFCQRVLNETGFKVHILSGAEEAQYTYRGAKSVLHTEAEDTAVIDIGGGSTEIAVGKEGEINDWFSFNIGSVRFTERYLKDRPPGAAQINVCRSAIAQGFEEHVFDWPASRLLIGVAGTVTSLAAIQMGLNNYDPEKLNGAELSLNDISKGISTFSMMSIDEMLEKYPVFLKGRADVFLAGLLILEGFMKIYEIPRLLSSTGGIRHGALLK